MKHMNIVVSVIIAAAVLVAAYGVGLLVRHARMDRQLESAVVMPTENPATLKARMTEQLPGGRPASIADTNQLAQAAKQREETLKKMKNMTKEEKRQFMEAQALKRFSAAGGREPSHRMSPEEREKMLQKWQSMSEDEKRTFDTRMAGSGPAPGEPPQAPANAENAATQQNPEAGASEPNKAGKG